MFRVEDGFGPASAAALRQASLPVEELTPSEAARRFPQINFDGVKATLWEPDAGYLFARRACGHVVERLVAEGGAYRQAAVKAPVEIDGPELRRVPLAGAGAGTLEADAFVFACGPWLGEIFPSVLGTRLSVTRQEVYYFGTPAGDARFVDPAMPVWLDYGERVMYGIPGNAYRGFKVADDTSGPPMDPTSGSRDVTAAGAAAARAFLQQRFPALGAAPLLGSEVCQYESTPDAHYVVDRHPAASNVWIAGGGSGHGFKMGPVIGEMLEACVLDGVPADPQFAIARLATPPAGGWGPKWS
jgi:glycine/D-amino acid oxidase-like deaminating enzyme